MFRTLGSFDITGLITSQHHTFSLLIMAMYLCTCCPPC